MLVYEQTRSPGAGRIGHGAVVRAVPVGGALFGAAADRLPPGGYWSAARSLSTVLVAAMVIPGMPLAALLGLVFGTASRPGLPGCPAATLPDLLPPGPGYILGRSMMRMVAQSAQIVGFGAGGLLLALASPRGALAIDAASFAALPCCCAGD